MTINEVVKKINQPRIGKVDNNKIIEEVAKLVETKPYLPVAIKKEIVSQIIQYAATVDADTGLNQIIGTNKYVATVFYAVKYYTNIELGDMSIEEGYDILAGSGILPYLVSTFKTEYEMILTMTDLECDAILFSNSVEAQVARFAKAINEKMNISLTEVLKAIGFGDV